MLLRQAVYYSIIGFTLRMMNGMMSSAFHQRLSTDWHANSFAGSTVRKTRAACGRSTSSTTRC